MAEAAEAVLDKGTVRLQVAAARQEESGRGVARMPRTAFQALGNAAQAEPPGGDQHTVVEQAVERGGGGRIELVHGIRIEKRGGLVTPTALQQIAGSLVKFTPRTHLAIGPYP